MKYVILAAAVPLLGALGPGVIGTLDSLDGFDRDFMNAGDPIAAVWSFTPQDHFEWAIGTSAGASDIQGFQNVGSAFNATSAATAVAGMQYFVTVNSVDATGGVVETYISDGITALGPSAAVAGPNAGPAPLDVTFIVAPLPGVVLYEWDFDVPFNPGKRAAKAMAFSTAGTDYVSPADGNASFTYNFPGIYDATLTLTHAGGEVKDVIVPVMVGSGTAPVVSVTADVVAGDAPLAVNLTAVTSGKVSSYFWDVDNDGAFDASSDSSPNLAWTFREPGTFTVKVTVAGEDGASSTSSGLDITVNTPSPANGDVPSVNSPGATSPNFRVGEQVVFTVGASAGATGTIVSYAWDFEGDGQTDLIGPASTVTWVYEKDGTYLPKVTVTDSEGLAASNFTSLTIFLDAGVPRIWLVEPETGLKVDGNFVSLTARAVPSDQVTGVSFFYRAVGANIWIPINATPVAPPPDTEFGTHWDTTALATGAPGFELMASADFGALGTADSSAILVVVVVDRTDPDLLENSGSPFTKLKTKGVNPNANATVGISRDVTFKLQAGSTTGYDRMRIERRSENPHPVESTLQGLRFVPGHFRRQGFASGQPLQKPSKVSMYLDTGSSDILPDGTDLNTASYKLMRFNDGTLRWEPLHGQTFTSSQKLLQAFSASTGDVAIAIVSARGDTGSSSGCGALGLEVLAAGLAAAALGRRLRRRS